jgi:hypothetical protein
MLHNDVGAQVVDTVTVADSAVLLPFQDGAAAKCRRANIKFAHVQLNLDFFALFSLCLLATTSFVPSISSSFHRTFVTLPFASNQAYRLTNYLGPGDL